MHLNSGVVAPFLYSNNHESSFNDVVMVFSANIYHFLVDRQHCCFHSTVTR